MYEKYKVCWNMQLNDFFCSYTVFFFLCDDIQYTVVWERKGLWPSLVNSNSSSITKILHQTREIFVGNNVFHHYVAIRKSRDLPTSHLSVVWFDWWIFTQFWVCVFIVHIVADADEFLATVCAGYQHHSYTNGITFGNQAGVRRISLLKEKTEHLWRY